jgi:hypothetical protein
MGTVPTLELAAETIERGARHHDAAAGARRYSPRLPRALQAGLEESVAVREAYLVDSCSTTRGSPPEGEARAARRTVEGLDARTVKEPWRVARDMAGMNANKLR